MVGFVELDFVGWVGLGLVGLVDVVGWGGISLLSGRNGHVPSFNDFLIRFLIVLISLLASKMSWGPVKNFLMF